MFIAEPKFSEPAVREVAKFEIQCTICDILPPVR